MGERVPQHIQNIIIRTYCAKNSFEYLLSVSEYAMVDCYFILKEVIRDMDGIDGIVAYSIFQLPERAIERREVYTKILAAKKQMHFAVEDIWIGCVNDIEKIELLWKLSLSQKFALPNLVDIRASIVNELRKKIVQI